MDPKSVQDTPREGSQKRSGAKILPDPSRTPFGGRFWTPGTPFWNRFWSPGTPFWNRLWPLFCFPSRIVSVSSRHPKTITKRRKTTPESPSRPPSPSYYPQHPSQPLPPTHHKKPLAIHEGSSKSGGRRYIAGGVFDKPLDQRVDTRVRTETPSGFAPPCAWSHVDVKYLYVPLVSAPFQ